MNVREAAGVARAGAWAALLHPSCETGTAYAVARPDAGGEVVAFFEQIGSTGVARVTCHYIDIDGRVVLLEDTEAAA